MTVVVVVQIGDECGGGVGRLSVNDPSRRKGEERDPGITRKGEERDPGILRKGEEWDPGILRKEIIRTACPFHTFSTHLSINYL